MTQLGGDDVTQRGTQVKRNWPTQEALVEDKSNVELPTRTNLALSEQPPLSPVRAVQPCEVPSADPSAQAHSHAASGYADGLRNPRRQQIASGLETAAVFKAPAPILGCLTIRHYPRASCSEFCITWQYRSPSFPGAPQWCCSGSRMSEFH